MLKANCQLVSCECKKDTSGEYLQGDGVPPAEARSFCDWLGSSALKEGALSGTWIRVANPRSLAFSPDTLVMPSRTPSLHSAAVAAGFPPGKLTSSRMQEREREKAATTCSCKPSQIQADLTSSNDGAACVRTKLEAA